MGAPQFTPGPWERCAHLALPQIPMRNAAASSSWRNLRPPQRQGNLPSRPRPSAQGAGGQRASRYPREVEIANARLIAAAPELYEAAAKQLCQRIEKEHCGPEFMAD
jgi:hypothetical protein